MPWIRNTLEWKPRFRFPRAVSLDLVLRNRTNLVLRFPGTMLVIETSPFAVILDRLASLSVSHNAFDNPVLFVLLLFALLVQEKSFCVFARKTRGVEARLINLVGLDVIIDTFEAFKSLEKLVGFVSVVQMRKVFPFDMETL